MSDLDESRTAVTPTVGALSADETLVDLRCSVIIFRQAEILSCTEPISTSGDVPERGAGLDRFGP